jgi:hypothetical protein
VLGGWAYHNGTRTGGVPTYENSEAVAKFVVAKYPGYNPGAAHYKIMPALHAGSILRVLASDAGMSSTASVLVCYLAPGHVLLHCAGLAGTVLSTLKTVEMFLDLTLAVLLHCLTSQLLPRALASHFRAAQSHTCRHRAEHSKRA